MQKLSQKRALEVKKLAEEAEKEDPIEDETPHQPKQIRVVSFYCNFQNQNDSAFRIENESEIEFNVELDKLYLYDINEVSQGLQRQGTIDTRSKIGSKFNKNYKDISIGFNKSRGDFEKAKKYCETKSNHETYRILMKIYENLKQKIK